MTATLFCVEVECLGDDVWASVFESTHVDEANAVCALLDMRPFAARVSDREKASQAMNLNGHDLDDWHYVGMGNTERVCSLCGYRQDDQVPDSRVPPCRSKDKT